MAVGGFAAETGIWLLSGREQCIGLLEDAGDSDMDESLLAASRSMTMA